MEPGQFHAYNSCYLILRELFFRLAVCFEIESSLSKEIIAFWLWLQGNSQAAFLLSIESFDDNHFDVIASAAKPFVEVLHFEFDGSDPRSVPRNHFQREAIEGISFYLNKVCYEALEVLQERANMNFFHNQMADLYQKAYGEFMNDKVPISSMTDLHKEAYGNSMNDQVPLSSKHLLTKIKALYANTQKHHGGEGTSSRNLHVQTSHMLLQDIKEVYECQPTSRLVTLFDNLSFREKHDDPIMQQLSDVPRDERTLFVTFSNGYPLRKDELHDFFMRYAYHLRHYGDVEEISVEEPIGNRQPLYAHVIFYSQVMLFRVLNGNLRVKFTTRGKHLWARQYVPKKKNTKS